MLNFFCATLTSGSSVKEQHKALDNNSILIKMTNY